ncbi:hypothetical protein [Kordiimonas sp.]|uniref:hypothetical protein n=1 Tax=Kordiimonas sp. TaxID=1970157 RepID=UPI003A91B907
MRTVICGVILLALAACASHTSMGPWPDTAYERKILERPSLEGRIVAIEQVPRFLVNAGQSSALNHDASFDHYLFWDWCRGKDFEWQMVTLRPDGRANSGWSFTRTIMTSETEYGRDIRVTEGFLKGDIADYQVLRAAGLGFFTPGAFKCNIRTADAVANKGA